MKKLLTILSIATVLGVKAQTTKVISYPFGAAQSFTCAPSGTVAVTVSNQAAYMSSVPTLTANTTLSVTAASSLKAGAVVLVAIKTTSTEVVTYGGSLKSLPDTGVVGKTFAKAFMYNGSYFYPMGSKQQID